MKNIKNLLLATIALVSASSMASLMQPHVPTSEEAPVRVIAGLQTGLVRNTPMPNPSFGINNLGLGFGFAHNVGYNFEYGLAVAGNWAAPENYRLFTADTKDQKNMGMRLEVELLARFMPELADSLNFGAFVSVGYNAQFGGEALKPFRDLTAFGDMSVRAGLALSYGFTDSFSMYLAPAYALTAIRFANSTVPATGPVREGYKAMSNLSGIEVPVGALIQGDSVGFYIEANTRFRNVKTFGDSWKEDVTVGVTFAM